ncbi:unnamed protein product [Phyllotreta striolata]|uniref:Uncharacterized protein n=1 Tax=Phyllotreta striolata TaxID=444603 RepID=A0A9N9TBK6_PHYSR|nr:unnamed protein product [Phyllotreta striolata]
MSLTILAFTCTLILAWHILKTYICDPRDCPRVVEASYKDATQFFLLLLKFMINLFVRAVYDSSNNFEEMAADEFVKK